MHLPRTDAATPLHDLAALRQVEARAHALLGDDFELMQRAGAAAWRHALEHWPGAQRIVVACGPGNNGGDGYVFARHALAAGRAVQVLHGEGQGPRSGSARRAWAGFVEAGGRTSVAGEALPPCDLVVDALFGLGYEGREAGGFAALVTAIARSGAPVLSLDLPSGVDGACGAVPGVAVRATRTLQFIAHHAGLATGKALDHIGELDIATLDVPAAAFDGVQPIAWRLRAPALQALLPLRRRSDHKGNSGHVLVAGGDHGMGGAVLLAAAAALRAGAGLVSVATRRAHVAPLLARSPEAMAHAIEEPAGLAPLVAAADVCAIGPGLGRDEWGAGVLREALAGVRPLVIDADALNLLALSPRSLPATTVLTPHPGEAARLLGRTVADIEHDRIAAAHALRARFGCAIVLKGAGTVVAAPGAPTRIIDAGNPGMAVGGMGDVLTGIIAALRAQGLPAAEAAAAGALQHAAAGDHAAGEGMRGLLPTDLIAALRRTGGA